jgi:hypothetical protein
MLLTFALAFSALIWSAAAIIFSRDTIMIVAAGITMLCSAALVCMTLLP